MAEALTANLPLDAEMNDPETRGVELVLLTAFALVDAVQSPVIVSVPVEILFTPATAEAVTLPVMVTDPVETLFTPKLPVEVPPVTLPIILSVPPVVAFCAPNELPEFCPPVTPPVVVIVIVPLEALFTAPELVPWPPITLPVPVIVTEPVEVLFMPKLPLLAAEPVTLPTTNPTAGEAALNCRQWRPPVADLLVTLAVSVIPSLRVKMPVPALDTSSQVALAVMVIVCPLLARASSPTVGTTPPTHVAVALKLPLAADTMSAMA
jgi:hypothetical protein